MNINQKFIVCLFSDANGLAINILEQLLTNNCYVNIVTEDKDGWTEKTSRIVTKNRFSILGRKDLKETSIYSYCISCFGFMDRRNVAKEIYNFTKLNFFKTAKVLIVLPQESYGIINNKVLIRNENLGVIYTSDTVGPRMDTDNDLKISRYIKEIVYKKKLTIPNGETLTPVFINDVAKQIAKWLFAFGPFGKEILVKGVEISNTDFWITSTKLLGDIKLVNTQDVIDQNIPINIETTTIQKDLSFMLNETYRWILENEYSNNNKLKDKLQISSTSILTKKPFQRHIEDSIVTPSFTKNIDASQTPDVLNNKKTLIDKSAEEKETQKNRKYKINFILLPILTILFIPIILLIISSGLVYGSYKLLLKGDTKTPLSLLSINKTISTINYYESKTIKYIPLLGQIYKETAYSSSVFVSISNIGKEALPLIKTSENLFTNILGKNSYLVENTLFGTEDRLQKISNEFQLFKEITITNAKEDSFIAQTVLKSIDFEKYNNTILQAIEISKSLPDILGEYSVKNYLILFQNNMELRPTGGFIGSFGLVTFEKGRLTEFNVSDVYSADGQLKGHVEPPMAIKNYLNEANWWLRDSNWDPDFPISAKRVEWFLDKEIDKQVDGVVAIDLNPIKDFLRITGSIYLSDYGIDINDTNLYEKVQSEVQDNSFAGTHQKASFLTALSRSILNKVTGISFSQKISTLKSLYSNLEERHVQMYIHNEPFQKALSRLNWDGSVSTPSCGENCISDLIGIVEANVGVNKANYFIDRNVDMNVNFEDGKIVKSLTLTIENNASKELGLSGIYRAYVRLLVPEDSKEFRVMSQFGQNTEELKPEIMDAKNRKEVGVLFEIYPGETKKYTYFWTSDLTEMPDVYNVYIRKQAGVDEYPLNIRINVPFKIIRSTPSFTPVKGDNGTSTLQDKYEYWYNTTLPQDLNVRISI